MGKILKFCKSRWYMIVIIFVLLLGQAMADLRLPGYTSDIVDVGIQYKGVKYSVPERMSEETYLNLLQFLNDEDRFYIEELADFKNNEVYLPLENISEEELDKVQGILLKPELILFFISSQPELSAMSTEQIMQMMPMLDEKMAEYPDYMVEGIGRQFVLSELENMGVDMDSYQMNYLLRSGAKMLLLAIIVMLFSIAVGFFASRLAAFVAKELREKLFSKIMSFSNAEMNDFSTSSLITRCTNDVQQIQMTVTMLFRMVLYAPILGIGAIIKVMNTAPSMAWVIALAVVVMISLIMILMTIALPKFKIMQTLVDGLNLVSREILTGLSVIRAFGREEYEEKRFEEASKKLYNTQLFTSRTMIMMMPIMTLVMNGVSVLIIWVGAHQIDLGNLQVGQMIAFLTYAVQIIMSFLMISMVAIMLPRASVAAGRIEEVLQSNTLILDVENPTELGENKKGEVSFDHVSFKYPGADENVLEDICFTSKPGQVTAIIGGTGSGKSTLVNLIPRLYDVTDGKVTVDNVDIRNLKMKELRKLIGFVPQKGVLFSGTMKSNISYGKPDATMEDIEEAANISQAAAFIEKREDKYDTQVAQGGNNVSGGQRQRLSIARAIAKNPKIYVFDDSFSALDFKTEAAVRNALKEKTKDATVFIVAQRISTILDADQILVLDDGKLVGIGTHDELIRNNPVYRQIAVSQLSAKDLENMGVVINDEMEGN